MYQQINLYQPVLRQQRKIFSAATMLQIIAIAVVTGLGCCLQAGWTVQRLEKTSNALNDQYLSLNNRLGTLEAVNEIPSQAQLTMVALQARQQRYQQLETRLAEAGQGFSKIFDALARRGISGLWLTGIQLQGNGNNELRGTTVDAELVPRYLQGIADEPGLMTLPGGTINLARRDDQGKEIDFVLQTRGTEPLP